MTEQMDLINIIRRVIRQWFLIFTVSITVALLTGVVTSRIYRPIYETQALIAVYSKDGYGTVVENAEETAELFQEIIASNLLQKKVAELMGISALSGTISCNNVPKTNMITMKVTASTPQDAMVTINGFLDYYDVVTEQFLSNMVLQVLEDPQVPTEATKTYDEARILSTGFVGSAVLICVILFLYYYFRDDIKNEQQVEKKLDTKLFATIYHEDKNKGFRLPKRNRKKAGILVTNPVTSFGYIETFQKMCMRMEHQTKQKGYKSIIITSVQENEGKSTVSANLALSLARIGKKVLLVDLDLRKPALFKIFEIAYEKADPQVGDVLSGIAEMKNAVRKIDSIELDVLAGNRSYRNSTKVFIKESAVQAIEAMKTDVDYVIMDTAPLSMVADAEEVMRNVDAGILVVRQNCAKTKDINDAIDVFRNTGCKLLGCVFNDVESGLLGSTIFRGESYNYRYGYGKRYNHYNKEKAE